MTTLNSSLKLNISLRKSLHLIFILFCCMGLRYSEKKLRLQKNVIRFSVHPQTFAFPIFRFSFCPIVAACIHELGIVLWSHFLHWSSHSICIQGESPRQQAILQQKQRINSLWISHIFSHSSRAWDRHEMIC